MQGARCNGIGTHIRWCYLFFTQRLMACILMWFLMCFMAIRAQVVTIDDTGQVHKWGNDTDTYTALQTRIKVLPPHPTLGAPLEGFRASTPVIHDP